MKINTVENSNISDRKCAAYREDQERSPTRRSAYTQLVTYFSVLFLPISCMIILPVCLLMPARAAAQQSTASPCPPSLVSIDGVPVNTQETCESIPAVTPTYFDTEYGPTQIDGGVCPNIPSSFPTTYSVNTEAEFDTAYASVQPGEAIILEDGTYTWTSNKTFNKNGTEANPIYIIYETLHGFICNNCSKRNLVTGDFHVFAGFTYNNFTGRNYFFSSGATGNRVACMIFNDSTDIFVHVGTPSQFSPGARDLEVDNNEFIQGGFIQLNVNDCGIKALESWCTNAHNVNGFHFHHNSFIGPTAQEAIKLGLTQDAYIDSVTVFNDNTTDAIIENNLFDNTNGDIEILSIKSGHNIIRNNCFQNTSSGIITIRLGHDNLIHGNWGDEVRDGARIAGHRNYVLFNYMRTSDGTGTAIILHHKIEHPPGPRATELNYHVAKDGVYEFNVFTGTDYMIAVTSKNPADGTVLELPNGNTFQNNDVYSDSLVGSNDSGSFKPGGEQTESNFRANNTWGSNSVVTSDLSGSTCGNAALFDGPGTSFDVPSTVLGGARTISAPTWW